MSVIDERWDFYIENYKDAEVRHFTEFELQINNICENVLKVLEDSFLIQNPHSQALKPSYDDELKSIVESNKELRQEIDFKLKVLTQKQEQYESFKKDQKLLCREIKETHEAFLMAKKYYKKFLKFYFTIESKSKEKQIVFVQFFTEVKTDNEEYSVRIERDIKTAKYELLSSIPNLKNLKELRKKLKETNDVPGALSCIRQAFLNMKEAK